MVISCSLRPNPQGDCTITTTTHNNNTASDGGNGNRCVFGKSNTTRTVFVDKCITEGIYRWTVKVDFSQGCNFFIGCAMCSGSSLSVWDDNWLGDSGSTCSVEVYASGAKTALHGVHNDSRSERKVSITCSSLLSLEIDSTAGTLSFFIDEKKEPFVISKIRVPLYFGLSKSFNTAAFTSLSLRRLAAATASPVVCTYFECNDA